MKVFVQESRTRVKNFVQSYGKLISFLTLIFICVAACSTLIVLGKEQKLQVTFFDVGQGDAILIETPHGHQMLIDGGPSKRIVELLEHKLSYFDRSLDVVVETHPDSDHVTGLIPVLETFSVDHILASPQEGHTGIFDVLHDQMIHEGATIHSAKKDDRIIFDDGVLVEVLYPTSSFVGDDRDTNSASVSLLLTYGNQSILLTGDLPSVYEHKLLVSALSHHVTIYKAGHHGSKSSSGNQLLSYIQPEYAVVSAGKDNKYGHPNPETMERLKKYSKEILSTIDKGTISFLLDGKSMEVVTSR